MHAAVQRTKHAYIHHKNNVQNAIRLLSLEHVQDVAVEKKKSFLHGRHLHATLTCNRILNYNNSYQILLSSLVLMLSAVHWQAGLQLYNNEYII